MSVVSAPRGFNILTMSNTVIISNHYVSVILISCGTHPLRDTWCVVVVSVASALTVTVYVSDAGIVICARAHSAKEDWYLPWLIDLWVSYRVKAALWDDINFCFYFCNEVVYLPDHDFIFFRVFRFLEIFFINIPMNPLKTQTNFLVECSYSIGPHVDAVGPTLGRQSVLQVYPPMSWL